MSVLGTDGWLEFNRYKWGVKPLKVRLTENEKELPAVEAVLYLDRRGRIVQPPLNAYLPIAFYPTPTDKLPRLYRQWASVTSLLADEFARRGTRGTVAFPPEVTDVRQWQWRGFLAEVRYTFYLALPYNPGEVDHSERKQVQKAERSQFACATALPDQFQDVVACLAETEERQGFRYSLDVESLQMALQLLGRDLFRVYICRSAEGEVASTRIVLSLPGSRAVDWVAGTRTAYLHSGATQLLIHHALEDLARVGATGFDFAGANLPTVSAAKADWGGRLIPYYVVLPLNLRTLGRLGLRTLQQVRRRK